MRITILMAFLALSASAGSPQGAPVTVAGAVPDHAAKTALLARVRELYGEDQVLDRLTVGGVASLPQWQVQVHMALGPSLRAVSGGQLRVEGRAVSLSGAVPSEALRQQIGADLAAALGPEYAVQNGLRVVVSAQQNINELLRLKTVQFESGKAVLTDAGARVLDEMHALLKDARFQRLELIGHTDNVGARAANLALSLERAQAVRAYMTAKGIDAARISVSGEGPDRPVADHANAQNRARNRRIEVRVIE